MAAPANVRFSTVRQDADGPQSARPAVHRRLAMLISFRRMGLRFHLLQWEFTEHVLHGYRWDIADTRPNGSGHAKVSPWLHQRSKAFHEDQDQSEHAGDALD